MQINVPRDLTLLIKTITIAHNKGINGKQAKQTKHLGIWRSRPKIIAITCYYQLVSITCCDNRLGHVVNIQSWGLRRLISTYNYLLRRPHVPREKPLRRIMKSQGIDIDVDFTPSTPADGNDDEESGPGIEEESEEEDFTDDESI